MGSSTFLNSKLPNDCSCKSGLFFTSSLTFLDNTTAPGTLMYSILEMILTLSPKTFSPSRVIVQLWIPVRTGTMGVSPKVFCKSISHFSRQKSRIEDYPKPFISTLFCYGCFMEPSQAAPSIEGVSRTQLAWIHDHHINAERLNNAITKVEKMSFIMLSENWAGPFGRFSYWIIYII